MHNKTKQSITKNNRGAHDGSGDARRRHLLSTFVLITENKEPKKCRRLDIKDRWSPTILNAGMERTAVAATTACVTARVDVSSAGFD